MQHRQQAESVADQVGSKDKGEEGRGRREGSRGIRRPATTARTTRTTRSNIDSNKNNSCLPFVSEFHSLLPLLPLSSGSCTAALRLRLLLSSPSPLPALPRLRFVLYFTCCRTKKIQLKRNNIALHHQSSCSSLLILFRLRQSSTVAHQHTLPSSAAARECDAGDKSLSPNDKQSTTREREREKRRGSGSERGSNQQCHRQG